MFQFLLHRFRPGCWWWGNVVLLRQLLLAFAPVLPADEPHAQAVNVSCVLSFYSVFASNSNPWKSRLLNFLDLVQCLGLFTFIASATSFMETSKREGFYEMIMLTSVGVLVMSQLYVVTLACA